MKYKTNHKDRKFAHALGLSKQEENKLNSAIAKAYDETPLGDDGMMSMDGLFGFVAPYINTAEQAFFAAATIAIQVCQATQNYYSKRN